MKNLRAAMVLLWSCRGCRTFATARFWDAAPFLRRVPEDELSHVILLISPPSHDFRNLDAAIAVVIHLAMQLPHLVVRHT